MINCAHPSHFETSISGREGWLDRIRGVRANASRKSHAELDEAQELDAGDPVALGKEYRELRMVCDTSQLLGAAAALITGISWRSATCATPNRRLPVRPFSPDSLDKLRALIPGII